MKRQPPGGEKIFTNHIPDTELTSKMAKKILQCSNQKSKNLIKKWAKNLNRHFSKEDSSAEANNI